MEWWSKMTFPLRKVWFRVSKRLGIRKTGLLKLHKDVKTCEYQDVHVLWELLKKNESGIVERRKRGHLSRIFSWAKQAPFMCRGA